nr:hypothetical protein [Myxococcus hansupus]
MDVVWPLAQGLRRHAGGARPAPTRIACLDQAARPQESIFWLEYEGRQALRAGWGVSGAVAWTAGQRWDMASLPALLSEGEGTSAEAGL